jgi:mono/diheme cytochrome c family protein
VRRRAASDAALALLALALLAAGCLAAAACGPDDGTPAGLYRKHCARCHGLDGRGNRRTVESKPGLDLSRSELLAAGRSDEVYHRIEHGEGTMPAFGNKLSREQMLALVDLSYELAGIAPPTDTPDDAPTR